MKYSMHVIIILFMLCAAPHVFAQGTEQQTQPAKPAYDFTAKTLSGEDVTLSNYFGKKFVLVGMWATW